MIYISNSPDRLHCRSSIQFAIDHRNDLPINKFLFILTFILKMKLFFKLLCKHYRKWLMLFKLMSLTLNGHILSDNFDFLIWIKRCHIKPTKLKYIGLYFILYSIIFFVISSFFSFLFSFLLFLILICFHFEMVLFDIVILDNYLPF